MNPTQPSGTSTAPAVPPPSFYTVPEAARLTRMAPVTIYRAIRNGEFPAVRIRGRLIIPARAIEAMIDAALMDQGVVDASGWVVVQR
jgi:excisionase family DNA binding protein